MRYALQQEPCLMLKIGKYITQTLERARMWDKNAHWDLWPATDSYKDMPLDPPNRTQPDGSISPPAYGTESLMPESYKSPWYGTTVEDCARWL